MGGTEYAVKRCKICNKDTNHVRPVPTTVLRHDEDVKTWTCTECGSRGMAGY